MKHFFKSAFAFFVIFLAGLSNLFADNNLQIPALESFDRSEDGTIKAWIFFRDKGPEELLQLQKGSQLLSERAIKRRLKVKEPSEVIDYSDKRIYQPYINSISPYVENIRVKSRWLNGISVDMPPASLDVIKDFEFVVKIKPVRVSKHVRTYNDDKPAQPVLRKTSSATSEIDYGLAADQLNLINVPALHEKGLYGEGIVIGMLDDGFNLLYLHEAFEHLDIIATRDFIRKDESVDDSQLDGYEGWHGTKTLSTIAGYAPGKIVGPAFEASYILAKTEMNNTEIPKEEDFWVAGLEWIDSLGADLVSSSLGYIDWYSWDELDGETAVTTIAADMAVEKGLIIFNSVGNEYDNFDHNTLIAPSDGHNVISVGSVDRLGNYSRFSSVGPTFDGRIKPDIVAMGSSVVCAATTDTIGYSYSNGTSFSCPLAAGAAALLISAFPNRSPEQIRHALRSTASQAEIPNKYLGWGVIDIEKAYNYLDTAAVETPDNSTFPQYLQIKPNYPNPFNPLTEIPFSVNRASLVEVRIFNNRGQELMSLGTKFWEAGSHTEKADLEGMATGIYFYRVAAIDLATGKIHRKTGRMALVK